MYLTSLKIINVIVNYYKIKSQPKKDHEDSDERTVERSANIIEERIKTNNYQMS